MTDSTVSHEGTQAPHGAQGTHSPRSEAGARSRSDAESARSQVDGGGRKRARLKLLALLLLLSSPIAASYYTYYVVRPDGRTNYGALVEQRPVGALGGVPVVGDVRTLGELHGRWIMLVVAPSDCDEDCRQRLYHLRQVRLTAGKERDRVERVWLLPDAGTPDPQLLAEHEGLLVIRAPGQAIAANLPATGTTTVSDHIWLIDPLGHLMMRFPRHADPSRIKKDLAKVLRASGIG